MDTETMRSLRSGGDIFLRSKDLVRWAEVNIAAAEPSDGELSWVLNELIVSIKAAEDEA